MRYLLRRQPIQRMSPAAPQWISDAYQSLEARQLLASLQLIAAGVTNDETIELQLAGQTVQTWANLGGNADAGQFVTLNYNSAGPISANDVRIAFTNDIYDPINNYDRNVRIDAIVIDGQRFETEAPNVYSTGTWKPEDGIVPGFRSSEYLHSDGYFQFAQSGGNTGSQLVVRARGDIGGEQFELQVDGTTVGSFTVSNAFQSFSYRAVNTVTANRVRVVFVNDRYEPANNLDYNLQVDYLSVDGTLFQTEAPNVYSTGTWQSGDGVVPGFQQSEFLHSNGYFQFEQTVQAGSFSVGTSVIRTPENAGQVSVTVVRQNGSDGTVTVDYRTVAITATAGTDYVERTGSLTFNPGETSKTVAITLLDDGVVEGDETFGFSIDNVTGGGSLTAPRTATITIEDNDAIRAAGTGLLGEYFDGLNFTNRFINRVDATVDFDWATGSPANGMGAETFSVRWTGRIEPRFSQVYTFQTRSDDGVRLWVNNQLIIDQWNDHAPTIHTGTIALQAGILYDLRLEYYENSGGAVMQLSWQSASQALQIIPRSQLYAADPPPVTPGDQLTTQSIVTGLVQPTALDFTPDGSKMYVAEQRGIIRVVDNGVLLTTPFLDFRDRVNGTRDRGLLDIAVHPNFAQNPYVYLLYTYDPPQVNQQAAGTLAGPDGNGNRAGRMTRVTADSATNFTTIIPNSEVVLIGGNSTWNNFNAFANSTVNFTEPPAGILPNGTNLNDFIATDSESHTVGSIEFGLDGSLFVSIGDGTSYNQVDPRTARVQDIDNLSGKILRVDPLTGRGLSNNPFYNGDPNANRSKVYQLGLRNPFRIATHPSSGQLYVGDVGWTQWEEINAAPAGANFGWPWYEGGNGANLRTGGYQNLAAAQSFYASGQTVTPSFYALSHSSGINAIVLGDFYSGSAYPASYQNNLFFNDLGQGIVRNIRFNANGTINSVQTFATGHQYVVQIQQAPDGNLYFVDLDNGLVGRWVFTGGTQNATAAGNVVQDTPPLTGINTSNGGQGITIALIDSGANLQHARLQGSWWTNTTEVPSDGIDNDRNGLIDDIHGYDFVRDQGDVIDPWGHGTWLADMMAGHSATGDSGLATGVQIMPLRVLGDLGRGDGDDVVAAIRYAVDHGAQIISLPLDVAHSDALMSALGHARDRGVLVVVAAGNQSAAEPSALAQASGRFNQIISAGAIAPDGSRLPESNQVGRSGAFQIDAPGIYRAVNSDDQEVVYRGTSVATGWLTAAAALAWSENRSLNASQIRELLAATGDTVRSGSDSLRRLNLSKAIEWAKATTAIQTTLSAGQWTVTTTPLADEVHYEMNSSRLSINGISFSIPSTASSIVIHSSDNLDSIQLAGSDANDYGRLDQAQVRLQSPSQTIAAHGFSRVNLWGSGGIDTVDLVAQSLQSQLDTRGDSIHWSGSGVHLSARQFEFNRVAAATGTQVVTMQGTSGTDRFIGGAEFVRLVMPQGQIQIERARNVSVNLDSGFDPVIFQGTQQTETLTLLPRRAWFSGSQFAFAIEGMERSTTYADGGWDQLSVYDGPLRDTVNALPANLLTVGVGYDHRAYHFEETTIRSSGHALDRITLRGTSAAEQLRADDGGIHYRSGTWTTHALGFAKSLVIGGGGDDQADVRGSASDDQFYFSPQLATWSTGSRLVTLQQFSKFQFQGGGGWDRVSLLDSGVSDHLSLGAATARLTSASYQVEWNDFDWLRARSLVDESPDTLELQAVDLDYWFESVGDWRWL